MLRTTISSYTPLPSSAARTAAGPKEPPCAPRPASPQLDPLFGGGSSARESIPPILRLGELSLIYHGVIESSRSPAHRNCSPHQLRVVRLALVAILLQVRILKGDQGGSLRLFEHCIMRARHDEHGGEGGWPAQIVGGRKGGYWERGPARPTAPTGVRS